MAGYDVAFVDSIGATPTVRLNLHVGRKGFACLADGTSFPPPELERVGPRSMMADGGQVASAAYRNRTITLALELDPGADADTQATQLQLLAREVDRPTGNFLRYRPDTSTPVFFRTFRSGFESVDWDPITRRASVSLLAEPFAYGLEQTLSPVTVSNDPAEAATLNANPYFETDALNWTPTGGTFVRSTAQFHEGVASGLLTPNGVTATVQVDSEQVTISGPGATVRARAWMRCAVARSVNLNINWYTTAGGYLSTSTQTIAVAATTWTLFDFTATAPATAGKAALLPSMTGTPAAGNLLHLDEARIGELSGQFLDLAAPRGDVETPLYLTASGTIGATGRLRSGIAVCRRGTPSAAPFLLQAESMTQGTNTTTQPNSASFSGTGNNYSRVAFVTTTMTTRLSIAKFPTSPSTDARGTYRVFARIKQNTGADVINIRLQWGGTSATAISNDTVRVPGDTNIKYLDLGLVQIPAGYDPVTDGLTGVELPTEGVYLGVQVERVSGAGSFDVDLLLFMPADDKLMFVKYPEVQATGTDVFVIEGGPRPAVYCLNVSGQLVSTQASEIAGTGLMITPGRTNRIYYARDLGTGTAATGTGDSVTATTTLTPSYFPRYLAPLRPATT